VAVALNYLSRNLKRRGSKQSLGARHHVSLDSGWETFGVKKLTVILALAGMCTGCAVSAELEAHPAGSASRDAVTQRRQSETAVDGTSSQCLGTELRGTSTQRLRIVVESSSIAIRRAAEDLKRDLQNKFGSNTVEIANLPDPGHPSIILSTGGYPQVTPVVVGPESHQIAMYDVGTQRHVLLRGSDERGTIYATYLFSEKVLGVPPLWYWAYGNSAGYFPVGTQPATQPTLTVPVSSCRVVSSPETKYRGAFLNDQHAFDLWAGQAKRQEKLGLFLETLLRLKLNVVHGLKSFDALIGESEDATKKAADTFNAHDRGLIVVRDWGSMGSWANWMVAKGYAPNTDSLPTLAADPMCDNRSQSKLVAYWTDSMNRTIAGRATYSLAQTKWYLGVRVFKDGGNIWSDLGIPKDNYAQLAEFEIDAIRCQWELLREKFAPAFPKVAIHVWQGIDDLYRNSATFRNALAPGGVLDDLTATFTGDNRTQAPSAAVTEFPVQTDAFTGYYHNLQFTSTGSHVVDGGGPWKSIQSFKYLRSRAGSPLRLGMMNVGSFRSFLLSAAVTADLLWSVNSYPATNVGIEEVLETYFPGTVPNGGQTTYSQALTSLLQEFLNGYWRQAATPGSPPVDRQWIWEDLRQYQSMMKLLDRIEDSASLTAALSSSDPRYFGIDLSYVNELSETEAIYRNLSMSSTSPGSVYRWREVLSRQNGDPGLDLGDVENGQMPNPLLFQSMFEAPIRAVIESARANYFIAVARKREADGNLTSAADYLGQAIAALDNMRQELVAAEFGEFDGWFRGERYDPDDAHGSYDYCRVRHRTSEVLCGLDPMRPSCFAQLPTECRD
jgi:Glycosyl hydrolase family 115